MKVWQYSNRLGKKRTVFGFNRFFRVECVENKTHKRNELTKVVKFSYFLYFRTYIFGSFIFSGS